MDTITPEFPTTPSGLMRLTLSTGPTPMANGWDHGAITSTNTSTWTTSTGLSTPSMDSSTRGDSTPPSMPSSQSTSHGGHPTLPSSEATTVASTPACRPRPLTSNSSSTMPSTETPKPGTRCSPMTKTTPTSSCPTTSTPPGGETKTLSLDTAMGTRESSSIKTLSSTRPGLPNGLLQLTFALCGSVVSTITTPQLFRNARWSTAPSPTSPTQRSVSTLTALPTSSDHSAATTSPPSVTVSAQSTLPSTATTTPPSVTVSAQS